MADKKKCSSEMTRYRCGNGHEFEILATKPKPRQCHCGNRDVKEVKNCGCSGECKCGKDKKGECKDTFEYGRGGCGSGCGGGCGNKH